jgi:hypothetical protein
MQLKVQQKLANVWNLTVLHNAYFEKNTLLSIPYSIPCVSRKFQKQQTFILKPTLFY